MFANVLVGVDGSPSGRAATTLAAELAGPHGRLTLAHVYGDVPIPGRHPDAELAASARERAVALLEGERARAGVEAELAPACSSSVGRGLHVLAQERAADLLVVGSHTGGLAGSVLVGDDTRASLNGATCAIAVAPSGYVAHTGGFLRIGVGYDFSDESNAALEAARTLAADTGATLSALHVFSPPTWGYVGPMAGNWGAILEARRSTGGERIGELDDVEATAVYGLPSDELAAYGDRVDLLVVGSRSYGPLRRLVLGSTSHALARRARCALLILPRAAAAKPGGGPDQVSTSLRSSA
jgi:nucleotide-binding universal stress UspA family protein